MHQNQKCSKKPVVIIDKEVTINSSEDSVKYSVDLIKTVNPFSPNVIKYDEVKILSDSNALRLNELENKVSEINSDVECLETRVDQDDKELKKHSKYLQYVDDKLIENKNQIAILDTRTHQLTIDVNRLSNIKNEVQLLAQKTEDTNHRQDKQLYNLDKRITSCENDYVKVSSNITQFENQTNLKLTKNLEDSKKYTDSKIDQQSKEFDMKLVKQDKEFDKKLDSLEDSVDFTVNKINRDVNTKVDEVNNYLSEVMKSNVNVQVEMNKLKNHTDAEFSELETKVSRLTKDYNELKAKFDILNKYNHEIASMRRQIANLLTLVEEASCQHQ